ncbi:DUF6067 family protein [Pontiellaceae bacterium B12227]|nr:DUF6067 family protein [Pontiellaceae bacterium B12227]
MKIMWVGMCVCLMAGYADGQVEHGSVDAVEYGVGNWPAFIENKTYNELGNHRAVIQVDQAAPAVAVHLPWRRRDDAPQNIDVVIVSAKDETRIENRLIEQASRESGDIVFEPASGAGTYYAYYLPTLTPEHFYKSGFNVNHHFPLTRYVAPTHSANADWAATYGRKNKELPQARLERIESRTEFDSFYPMEVIATAAETEALKKKAGDKAFVLFPESREFPIRMTEDLPLRWIKKGASNQFVGNALRNEYFAFQVGVYALKPVSGLRATFSDLVDSKGRKIPATALTCFNNGGTDWLDRDFSKTVDIPASRVQALWFGVDVADEIAAGTYRGKVVFAAENGVKETVALTIRVGEERIADRGDSEIWRHSRLRWLNSDIGFDTDVVAPFTAVEYENQTLSILGREILLNDFGMPQSVKSFIDFSDIKDEGREMLAEPIRFDVLLGDEPIALKSTGLKLGEKTAGKIALKSEGSWQRGMWQTDVAAEMDGYMRYRITLKADQDTVLKGAKLIIPMDKDVARYSKLSKIKGGSLAKGPKKASLSGGLFYNFAWMGDYNAGIACRPKNDEDEWNGDNGSKGRTPIAKVWSNDKTGEYRIEERDDAVYLIVDSGDHTLEKGEEIRFNFALFITPFKPVRADHWDFRYYHTLHGTTPKLQTGVEGGARYITAHHGSVQNPNLNYPFLAADALRESTLAAEEKGLGQKIYYTVRELSVYAPELWALQSLGDEIIMPGNGYRELLEKPDAFKKSHYNRTGFPWSCEHLVSNYINRWHTFVDEDKNNYDASISVQGLSRWHNYYIEGLRWLLENTGIAGIYLDGIGYDREIMKRLRKTLIRSNPDALIDYHSSSLIPVLEHMPYMDSVWIGEGADYDLDEDYWLIEVSGIPFGLSGETLKNSASPYRAMLYGMARRYGWCGGDPRGLWKWWDEFDIKPSRTIGFWDDACPAQTDHPRIRATAYVKSGEATAITLASWADESVKVHLNIDWKGLGLDPKAVRVYLPEIDGFQDGQPAVSLKDPIPVEPDKGAIVVIEQR